MKNIDRRVAKLERVSEPKQRFITALATPENYALAKQGLMPDNPQVPALYQPSGSKRLVRRRLGKGDLVIFLSAAEMAL
jgi:hypothetical protein